MLCTVGLIHLK